MLEGHCFCGFIRYEAEGPVSNETNCHCSMCRRISGAPLVAWVTVPSAGLRFSSGEPTTFRSSEHATRRFCPRCGTPLTFQADDLPDEVDITICSLDQPQSIAPKDHSRTSTKLPWVSLCDGLPAFDEARPSSDAVNAREP